MSLAGHRLLAPLAGGLGALFAFSSGNVRSAHADIVLHEYIQQDAEEDLALATTTSSGSMAGAIQTQSGAISAPDAFSSPATATVYGAGPRQLSQKYRIDRDTSRPDAVSYSDPFTPSVAPFKREFTYDAVDESLDLYVFDQTESALEIGGSPNREDDQFYADLRVELLADVPVRIPSVGPDTRVLAAELQPAALFGLVQDGAQNWYVRGIRGGRFRLLMHLAIDRRSFAGEFEDTDWQTLTRFLPPVSDTVREAASKVATGIDLEQAASPATTLSALVEHFRSFAPSTRPPTSTGVDYYVELALSKKGVCRHRAYSFVVTALGLGLPARFVRNEAHAWVEVRDARRWYRIDLGGAAGRVDFEEDQPMAHVPPRDPFPWPPGSDSGQAMADRARGAAGPGMTGSSQDPAAPTSGNGSGVPKDPVLASPDDTTDDAQVLSSVTLNLEEATALRGGPVFVRGEVRQDGKPCPRAQVTLSLGPRSNSLSRQPLSGGLVTDDRGRYFGRLTIDYGIAVGDYDVVASTSGGDSCASGSSR